MDKDTKVMEEDTRQIREIFFLQVLESLKEALIIIKPDNQEIIFYNKAAELLFGHPADEVINEPLKLLIPEDTSISNVSKAMITNKSYGVNKNGDKFPIEVSLSQFASTTLPYVVAVVRNLADVYKELSEIKNDNSRLKEFNSLLVREIKEPLTIISNYLLNFINSNNIKFDCVSNHNLHFALEGINRLKMLANSIFEYSVSNGSYQYETRKDIIFNETRPLEKEALTVLLNTVRRLEKINLDNKGEDI